MNHDLKIIATFVKRTNLMEFRKCIQQNPNMLAPDEYYSKERDVRLIVVERIDPNGRIFCRIKCPINPLPVKGEFEIPNWTALRHFLVSQGWTQHETITGNFLD